MGTYRCIHVSPMWETIENKKCGFFRTLELALRVEDERNMDVDMIMV